MKIVQVQITEILSFKKNLNNSQVIMTQNVRMEITVKMSKTVTQ